MGMIVIAMTLALLVAFLVIVFFSDDDAPDGVAPELEEEGVDDLDGTDLGDLLDP